VKFETPIILSGSALFGSSAAGYERAISPVSYRPLSREPFFVDSIIFSAKTSAARAMMAVKIALGRKPITDGYVRVWNFGPVPKKQSDPLSFRWDLDSPLLVMPDEAFQVSVKRREPNGTWFGDLLEVSLVGRYASSVPRSRIIPYVSSVETPYYDVTSGGLFSSQESQLRNNLLDQTILKVKRFVCQTTVVDTNFYTAVDYDYALIDTLYGEAAPLVKLEALADRRTELFDKLTEVWSVFDQLSGSLETSFDLAPTQGFRATLKIPANTSVKDTGKISTSLSFIASRQENVR